MDSLYICENCRYLIAECACLCSYPVSLLCAVCKEKHKGHTEQVPVREALMINSEAKLQQFLRFRQCLSHLKASRETLVEGQIRLKNCYNEAQAQLTAHYRDLSSRLEAAKDIVSAEVEVCAQLLRDHGLESEWRAEPNSLAEVILKELDSSDFEIWYKIRFAVSFNSDYLQELLRVALKVNFPMSKQTTSVLNSLKLNFKSEENCFLARVSCNFLYLSFPGDTHWISRVSLTAPVQCGDQGAASCFLNSRTVLICGGYERERKSRISRTAYTVDIEGEVTRLADMQVARAYAGVAGFQGSAYVFGGIHLLCRASKKSEQFADPSWTPLPNMTIPRSNFTPCTMQNFLYLCGCGSIDVYNPSTNSISPLSLPLPESSPCITCPLGEEMVVLGAEFVSKWKVETGELRRVGSARHANGWVADTCCQPRGLEGRVYLVRAGQVCVCDGLSGLLIT